MLWIKSTIKEHCVSSCTTYTLFWYSLQWHADQQHTHTHKQLFHCKNGYVNQPQGYVISTLKIFPTYSSRNDNNFQVLWIEYGSCISNIIEILFETVTKSFDGFLLFNFMMPVFCNAIFCSFLYAIDASKEHSDFIFREKKNRSELRENKWIKSNLSEKLSDTQRCCQSRP
jgi:hypothetical protein